MAEIIAIIRDIVIIIWGVLGIVMFIVVILVALGIYKAVKPLLANLTGTVGEALVTTRLVTDAVIRPAVPVVKFYLGVRSGLAVLKRFGRRRKSS